jgi:DNA-binding winged helix-turn-helix (wHTH) protein
MSPDVQARRRYRFGVFQLDTISGELYKHGIRIKLQDQPCQVLTVLLERVGEIVTREELRQRLWDHDTFVDFDHSLNISINKLRDALSDSATNPRFIETLPRKGYRFLAAVTVEEISDNRVIAPAPVISLPVPEVPNPSSNGNGREQIPTPNRSRLWLGIATLLLAVVASGSWLWRKQLAADKVPRAVASCLLFCHSKT